MSFSHNANVWQGYKHGSTRTSGARVLTPGSSTTITTVLTLTTTSGKGKGRQQLQALVFLPVTTCTTTFTTGRTLPRTAASVTNHNINCWQYLKTNRTENFCNKILYTKRCENKLFCLQRTVPVNIINVTYNSCRYGQTAIWTLCRMYLWGSSNVSAMTKLKINMLFVY